MTYNQILISIIVPIVVALGGYAIGAFANRKLVRADATSKISSSFSALVDDLQEENEKQRVDLSDLRKELKGLRSLYNSKLEELSVKYTNLIEEHVKVRSQYAEMKEECASHRERSKQKLESLQRGTDTKTEAMDSKMREYQQTIMLQEARIAVLEKSVM